MLDLVFPDVCTFCESVGSQENICGNCLDKIGYIRDRYICLGCGVPFGYMAKAAAIQGQDSIDEADVTHDWDVYPKADSPRMDLSSIPEHLCGRCIMDEFYFERARSIAFYDGLLKDILHKFKYEGKLSLGRILSSVLIQNLPADLDMPDIVIPVPLHIDRLRKREYNQSVILGEKLAKYLSTSFDPFVLRRVRDTKPQFEIRGDADKRRNVKGAFAVEKGDRIKGRSVLLVDDIFTSGSTINECSRVLLKTGVASVQVLTLARAV
jgi:ComF family protein